MRTKSKSEIAQLQNRPLLEKIGVSRAFYQICNADVRKFLALIKLDYAKSHQVDKPSLACDGKVIKP